MNDGTILTMSLTKDSQHFSEAELKCKCGCIYTGMNSEFMEKLEELRTTLDHPLILSSAYRCPDHNSKVSSTGRTGPHTTRKAVDILCFGKVAHRLLDIAFSLEFTGIGVKQKGGHTSRFIHLDTLDHTQGRPWVWSY